MSKSARGLDWAEPSRAEWASESEKTGVRLLCYYYTSCPRHGAVSGPFRARDVCMVGDGLGVVVGVGGGRMMDGCLSAPRDDGNGGDVGGRSHGRIHVVSLPCRP